MESQLKQRLIGAAVLVALAVIFLPMLVKGPAPDSGVSDVSLKVPDAPQGEYEIRDLPLVVPDDAPAGGVVGMQAPDADDGALPTVDTAIAPSGRDAPQAGSPGPRATMLPPTAAGGDYAVHFAAYDSSVSADTVVARLRDAQLPAYREASQVGEKQAWRVRVGPYATRADAEIARVEAARVGKYDGARVIALDAAEPAAAPVAAKPAPEPQPPARPEPAESTASTPVASKPADKPAEAPKPAAEPPKPAATAGVGFAVQIGAFSNTAQATAKRDELRAAGFSAFTETVQTDKGTLTRVLAGPVVSRPEAEQLNGRLRARLGIGNGLVRSHP